MSDFETIAEVWRNNNYPGVDRLTKLVKEKHPNRYVGKHQIIKLYQNRQQARHLRKNENQSLRAIL